MMVLKGFKIVPLAMIVVGIPPTTAYKVKESTEPLNVKFRRSSWEPVSELPRLDVGIENIQSSVVVTVEPVPFVPRLSVNVMFTGSVRPPKLVPAQAGPGEQFPPV